MSRSLLLLVLAGTALACGPNREAIVPLSPEDAATRAADVLESFHYNVVELDRDEGVVRGTRSLQHPERERVVDDRDRPPVPPREVIWEVRVHLTPTESGARYRLESRVAAGPDRLDQVDPTHLDRILAALADWKR